MVPASLITLEGSVNGLAHMLSANSLVWDTEVIESACSSRGNWSETHGVRSDFSLEFDGLPERL